MSTTCCKRSIAAKCSPGVFCCFCVCVAVNANGAYNSQKLLVLLSALSCPSQAPALHHALRTSPPHTHHTNSVHTGKPPQGRAVTHLQCQVSRRLSSLSASTSRPTRSLHSSTITTCQHAATGAANAVLCVQTSYRGRNTVGSVAAELRSRAAVVFGFSFFMVCV